MQLIRSKNKYGLAFAVSFGIVLLVAIVGLIGLTLFTGSFSDGFDYVLNYGVSDFGQLLYFTLSPNPYTSAFNTMYTPLNFLFILPFALICKGNEAFYGLTDISMREAYNHAILCTWEFWTAFVLYSVLSLVLIGVLLYRLRSWRRSDFFLAYGAVIFSNYFAFAISRGTNVFQVLVFLLFFLNFYKSEKGWLRELSYLALAIAGVMKFYPLLFGALVLREKKWFASLRIALYFFLLFFLPFLAYEGGFENVTYYLRNLEYFADDEGRVGESLNLSVHSLVYRFFALFGGEERTVVKVVSYALIAVVLAASAYVGIASGSAFSRLVALCCGMTLIPPVSYYYLVMFLVLPLSAALDEWGEIERPRRYFYIVFFSLMSFLPLAVVLDFTLQSLLFIAALVWECVRLIRQKINSKERI